MSFNIEKTIQQGMSLWEEKERKPKIDLSVPNSIISPFVECFKINSKHFQVEKNSQK